jgi:chemotaxis protein CheZ
MLRDRRAPAMPIDASANRPLEELKALRVGSGYHAGSGVADPHELMHELTLIRDAIIRDKRDLAALLGAPGGERRMMRAAEELGATIGGMENATQRILMETEIIDESARALSSSLKKEYELGLAQDILDSVVRVYEACNFQDLAGQRIGKVMATLRFIEEHVSGMIMRWGGVDQSRKTDGATVAPSPERQLVNGPKLAYDAGHVNQHDIDAMFN